MLCRRDVKNGATTTLCGPRVFLWGPRDFLGGPRDCRSALGAIARLAARRPSSFHSHPNLKKSTLIGKPLLSCLIIFNNNITWRPSTSIQNFKRPPRALIAFLIVFHSLSRFSKGLPIVYQGLQGPSAIFRFFQEPYWAFQEPY